MKNSACHATFYGSFTDICGGHVYPSRIRKEAPRPLRVFLQDGEADLDNQYGNW
jgi:enterochelin esterase family protein